MVHLKQISSDRGIVLKLEAYKERTIECAKGAEENNAPNNELLECQCNLLKNSFHFMSFFLDSYFYIGQ